MGYKIPHYTLNTDFIFITITVSAVVGVAITFVVLVLVDVPLPDWVYPFLFYIHVRHLCSLV